MSIEQGKEQIPSNQQNITEQTIEKTINNLQSLTGDVDLKAIPRISELMDIPGSEKIFQEISDLSYVCKGQNGAIDRRKMQNLCGVIDIEAHV